MKITFTKTDAWILIGIPNDDKGVSILGLLERCDALNHAIPTKEELEIALTKGIQSGMVIKERIQYKLADDYVSIYKETHESKGGLFALIEKFYKKLKQLDLEPITQTRITLSENQYKLACDEYVTKCFKF